MNFLKAAVIISFIIVTILSLKIHPDMHKPIIFEDASFKLERISDTIETIPTTVVHQETPSKQIDVPVVETPQNTTNIKIVDSQPQKIVVQQEQPQKVVTQKPEQSQLELLQRVIKNAEQKPVQEEIKLPPVQKPKTVETTPPKRVEQPEKIAKTPTQSTHKNPYMTEQEEIIAWNKWRSNIHNQIMTNSNIDFAPLGTAFVFSFMVDKFGNVSNIKVECSNPNLMEMTRKHVKPAIANLQRKPILNFPRGTQRTSTVVTGAFLIGTENRFASPDDFSDFERIKF